MNYIYFYGGFRGNIITQHHTTTDSIEAYVCEEPWLVFKSKLGRWLAHILLSPRINSRLNAPFKYSVLIRIIDKFKFQRNDTLCLLINSHFCTLFNSKLIRKLKKRYKNIKFALSFSDRVSYFNDNYHRFPSIDRLKKEFDILVSYNVEDCKKYNLVENRPIIQDFSAIEVNENIPKSDLFFVGKNKNRIRTITKLFETATKNGLVCDFYVTDVPECEQKYSDVIKYNCSITYLEVLQRVKRTNCVVNIIQEGGAGITMREYESLSNDKYLLTNNYAIKDTVFYSKEQVIEFEELPNRVEEIKNGYPRHNSFSKEYSFETYFEWLSDLINNTLSC